MHTFPTAKFLTLPASLGNRDHDINSHCLPLYCVSSYGALAHNYYGNLRLSGEKLPGSKPNLLEKKCPIQSCLRSVSQLDAKCSGGVGSPKARFPLRIMSKRRTIVEGISCLTEGGKTESSETKFTSNHQLLCLPCQGRIRFKNQIISTVFSLLRQAHNSSSKPFCPFEGYDLTSVPSRLLPATSAAPEKSLSGEVLKHRSRISNRTCSLFTIGSNQKNQSFPDPVAGAAASFIQRLSEISSLEGETIRQEKMKKIKKSRKLD